jgi:hypothetical protein
VGDEATITLPTGKSRRLVIIAIEAPEPSLL